MTWAAAYDTGDVSRTRAIHEQWLATLPCPVLRLTTAAPVAEHLDQVLAPARLVRCYPRPPAPPWRCSGGHGP
jgi:hypothetical protein